MTDHSLAHCYEHHATGDHATDVIFKVSKISTVEIVFVRTSVLGLELALCNKGLWNFCVTLGIEN